MKAWKPALFCAAVLAMTAAPIASTAWAWPGPSFYPPFFYPFPPPVFRAAPAPLQTYYRHCNGSEPLLGGIFGAWAGGLIGAALSQDGHGHVDPGAAMFGAITGAMLGATLAASSCEDN
jgi:hypothetical protein